MRAMAKQGKTSSTTPSATLKPAAGTTDFSALAASASMPPLNLADHFLIAMPMMGDTLFGGTVVYVCEHHAGGALGMIINRPTDVTVDDLFERIDLKLEIDLHSGLANHEPVMFGGPVQSDRGFVLHAPDTAYSSSLTVSDAVALTTSRDVLEAVADGHGPQRILITLGCAGWGAGQLEAEILRNDWLTVRADPDILYDTPIEERFSAAMQLLGIDPGRLSTEAGHA